LTCVNSRGIDPEFDGAYMDKEKRTLGRIGT